jgi:hypothetical protein
LRFEANIIHFYVLGKVAIITGAGGGLVVLF